MEEGAGLEDRAVLSVATGDKHKWKGGKKDSISFVPLFHPPGIVGKSGRARGLVKFC